MFRGRKVPRYLVGEKVKEGVLIKSPWALNETKDDPGMREQ
jgi:hypothetical protein